MELLDSYIKEIHDSWKYSDPYIGSVARACLRFKKGDYSSTEEEIKEASSLVLDAIRREVI